MATRESNAHLVHMAVTMSNEANHLKPNRKVKSRKISHPEKARLHGKGEKLCRRKVSRNCVVTSIS